MASPLTRPARAIDRVQPQRDRLRDTHVAFQQACERPDPSLEQVRTALVALREAFDAHVTYAEGPDGLFLEMQDDVPVESATDVDRLRRDHITIFGTIDRIDDLLTSANVAFEDERVQEATSELARLITQHRRRGAELLYNVYAVEVGGSD